MLRQYQRILFTCGHRSLTTEVKGSTDHLCSDLVRYDEQFLSIWVLGSMLKPKKEWIIMIEFKEKIWKECKKVQCMYLETS